jgi:hypothetical protein
MHVRPQRMNPVAQVRTHLPALQVVVAFAAVSHSEPHAPQFCESCFGSMQLESQSTRPAEQEAPPAEPSFGVGGGGSSAGGGVVSGGTSVVAGGGSAEPGGGGSVEPGGTSVEAGGVPVEIGGVCVEPGGTVVPASAPPGFFVDFTGRTHVFVSSLQT